MKRFLLIFTLVVGFALLAASTTNAQLEPGVFQKYFGTGQDDKQGVFTGVYQTGGDLESNLPAAVGSVISTFLGLIGVVLLVIIVYAGFLWLTAGGNEEQVKTARKWSSRNGIVASQAWNHAFIQIFTQGDRHH